MRAEDSLGGGPGSAMTTAEGLTETKAVGASAEFHDFQGGVVNIVTKSGSNNYHGLGSFYIIPPGLVGNNTPNEQFPF